MKEFIKTTKSELNHKLINEALAILDAVGIPFEKKTPKALQSMAMCFLAVAGVTKSWKDAKGQTEGRHLTTREIIKFINEHFEENISPGSYDDIRRKHLKLPVLADLILNSAKNPNASTNDPTRGYTLNSEFKTLITFWNTNQWDIKLKLFLKNRPPLAETLERKRNIPKIPITLPGNIILEFSKGEHNQLQREIIEEFLPRYGAGSNVLYIGDTSNKFLHKLDNELKLLGFELSNDELPDIVAYSKSKNWLYLIEAVYSSGPMSEERVLELKKTLKNCKAELIFVTAFISRNDFRKYIMDIAWETEVWTADNPDHLVHFNGDKFLGPYQS
ncbi:BsuBI/PstI family type II restriction endonuclease [Taibaiella koreensis]|uniref:BsuBI/PstI family type II restriction endonuclease n=1 Tax=Taibaiella koreensis TaxID=1268548 RepID=UPI000E59C72D|nr:BsuBI/PstI family type II restriction endonuclease [Taibaiella koreensis]